MADGCPGCDARDQLIEELGQELLGLDSELQDTIDRVATPFITRTPLRTVTRPALDLRRRIIDLQRRALTDVAQRTQRKITTRARKASLYGKIWGKHVREVRKRFTLKNGKLRQGWDSKRIAAEAHRLTRKEMKQK